MIGDVQVRNRGTIGGSMAHADPAGDLPAAMQMAEAQFKLIGPAGERTVPTEQFFVDLLTTALGPDELLAEIQVEVPPARTGTAYMKVFQKASGFAIVGVAARITLGTDGRICQTARVGITGVAAKSFRAGSVEQALAGKAIDEADITAAAEHASDGVEALSDLHAFGGLSSGSGTSVHETSAVACTDAGAGRNIVKVSGTHLLNAPRDRVWQCLNDPAFLRSVCPAANPWRLSAPINIRSRSRSALPWSKGNIPAV